MLDFEQISAVEVVQGCWGLIKSITCIIKIISLQSLFFDSVVGMCNTPFCSAMGTEHRCTRETAAKNNSTVNQSFKRNKVYST